MPSLGDVLLQNKAKNAGLAGSLQKQIAGQSPYGMLADMLMRNGYQQKAIEYAKAGSDYASQGADELRAGGNPLVGVPKIGLGALGWLTSPINAAVAPVAEPLMQPIASAVNDVFARPIESATGYPAELTTGLAMALLPGNKKGMRPSGLSEAVKGIEGITAYHASPHTFDKFDMSRIGSGEGKQAFGHGLYFAENPGVSGRGGIYDQRVSRKFGNPATIYEVRLNVKPDELLDWDKPLSEQSETVRKIAAENGWSTPPRGYQGSGELKGQNIYAWGTQKIGGKWDTAATTEKLKAAGIKGIRYKDAGSRTGEGGTYNYVIFDDSLIDILKRYGIPLAVGVGGAVTVSGKDMPPEVAAQLGPQT